MIVAILVILWVAYSIFMLWALFKIADMPPVPLFDVNSWGVASAFTLGASLWIGATCMLGAYLFGC